MGTGAPSGHVVVKPARRDRDAALGDRAADGRLRRRRAHRGSDGHEGGEAKAADFGLLGSGVAIGGRTRARGRRRGDVLHGVTGPRRPPRRGGCNARGRPDVRARLASPPQPRGESRQRWTAARASIARGPRHARAACGWGRSGCLRGNQGDGIAASGAAGIPVGLAVPVDGTGPSPGLSCASRAQGVRPPH